MTAADDIIIGAWGQESYFVRLIDHEMPDMKSLELSYIKMHDVKTMHKKLY